ncbi:MAG: ferrous iron transport protein B [Acidobacteria bacterium]|nr:ferrous iron transport protein B [Acidobacteriota bacterium]
MAGNDSCHPVATDSVDASIRAGQHYVALVGPPNAGKTTLFNRLTGLRQKVANFPGVTVEHHVGRARTQQGREVFVIDLPGVYSLDARSEDERVTADVLTGAKAELGRPDSVVIVLDATNLHRHLLLAAPVLALGLPTLVVLNMADDLAARGGSVDTVALAAQLGAPVALVSAAKGDGIDKVMQFLEGSLARPHSTAKRVELPVLQDLPGCRTWAGQVGTKSGYRAPAPPVWTRRLDGIFLHPWLGPLIFVLVVAAVFETIFSGAQPLMDAVEKIIVASGNSLAPLLPEGLLRGALIDGVWNGVGSVVVFLPQILLLFLFIGVLEDSGYLARAALIADRTMSRVGLQGKAFIPLLSAYACAVPAIMATRTIENTRDRIATILIAPFMTCSARLPVYLLIVAAFIPETAPFLGPIGARTAALLGLYIIGFLAAIVTAQLLRSTILRRERSTFILELPPYRMPSLRSLGLRLWDRALIFLKRAGTVILGVLMVLWFLANFPRTNGQPPDPEHSYAGHIGHAVEPAIKPLGFNWKVGVGIVASFAAREAIIGTLGTLYGIENADKDSDKLQEALRADLTPAGAAALLVFFAFAMQCFSTTAIVRRETGGWFWPAVQFSYMTAFAYCSALATHAIVSARL